MTSRVSLAELAAADIRLRPAEVVAIVAEISRRHARREFPGIPSPGIIRVTREGQVIAQGPMTREDAGISRAGQLLDGLLPGADAPAEYRASGGLRLVIARALGTLDLPPYSGLDEFCDALARFTGPDPGATMRGLFRRWEQPVTALVPSGPQGPTPIEPPVQRRNRVGLVPSALMVVVAALFAMGTFAIVMGSAEAGPPVRAGASTASSVNSQPPMPNSQRTAPVPEARPAGSARVTAATAPVRVSKATARPRVRRPPQQSRPARVHIVHPVPAARPRSFLNRELFRIVIK